MTLDEAIKVIKTERECVSRNDGMNCNRMCDACDLALKTEDILTAYDMAISALVQTRWIPVKWHEITDEEQEREGYPKDWVYYLDCIMPYDGQRILITTKGGFVELDECYSDDGSTFSLDSGYDWIDNIVAWMPLPEPYKAESEEKK